MLHVNVHVYGTTLNNFLSKVYILEALGVEIVRIPTTAAFNLVALEITIFL